MTASSAAAARSRKEPDGANLSREETILKHLPLVRAIAARVREGLPVQVELDDLVHAGVMGLFDAVDKYNPDKNVVFHLYAKHRIRGAILDSLRQLDWASRDLRKRFKSIESAAQEQAQRLGRSPNEDEVANALGITAPQLQRQKAELHQAGLTSIPQHRVEKPENGAFLESVESAEQKPDESVARRELRDALLEALGTLPPRYQRVVHMYYREERTMKQIGIELGVNESRVSQIHKSALEKLGVSLRQNGYGGAEAFLEAP